MVMAHPPATTTNAASEELTKGQLAVLDALERGETIPQIAKRLAKGDKAKAKKLRARLWKLITHDPDFQGAIITRSRAHLVAGLPATSKSLAGRSGRGRIDAAKLVMEATGFHNSRVKHEHSGDVTIHLDIPRPKFVDATSEDMD